jgi:hypothetical protein
MRNTRFFFLIVGLAILTLGLFAQQQSGKRDDNARSAKQEAQAALILMKPQLLLEMRQAAREEFEKERLQLRQELKAELKQELKLELKSELKQELKLELKQELSQELRSF